MQDQTQDSTPKINHVFLNPDGYVEATIIGDQDGASFGRLQFDAEEMLEILDSQSKRRLGLIDITKQGKFTTESNKAAMQIMETLNYEKLAIFGGNKVLTQVVNAIILAMGKTDNTKLFKDRESALAWLHAPSKS